MTIEFYLFIQNLSRTRFIAFLGQKSVYSKIHKYDFRKNHIEFRNTKNKRLACKTFDRKLLKLTWTNLSTPTR